MALFKLVLVKLHFLIICFIVWTYLSTIPFDCGYKGLDVSCLISQSLQKNLNSLLLKQGPLSENNTKGIPSTEKILCKHSITLLAVMFVTFLTSTNLEK